MKAKPAAIAPWQGEFGSWLVRRVRTGHMGIISAGADTEEPASVEQIERPVTDGLSAVQREPQKGDSR